MNWRTLLAGLLGILLPLPLVWLLSAISGPDLGQPRSQHLNVVPMLTDVERQNVLTYGRECHTDADCDPQLRCFFSMVTQDSYCVDSRCMTDLQCPDGFTCQTYEAKNGKDLLNACSLVGKRKEGEVCTRFTHKLPYACERGLLCHFRCGRPCRVDDPMSCPEGYFCEDDPTGAACQPTCEGHTCPEGQQCVSVGGHVSVCATVHGQNCQRTPCVQEQHCSVTDYPQPVDEVWMRCSQICGLMDTPPCPEGTVCESFRCRETCTPGVSTGCEPGYICKHRSDDVWLCAPDHRTDGED
ncbi:hypothetical protein DAT35_19750 [Vitiosangium sp. GDMCC 1.1324]|nr:hypothetical protein DAT35_19750 [Vitiosangium sp. GDMCC 1.1324]